MRYREYRRKCAERTKTRNRNIAKFYGFPSIFHFKNKENPDRTGFDAYYANPEDCDFMVKKGRARRSSHQKKQYARKLRRSNKINMIAFKGCYYKRASGDFWWDYC